KLIRYKGSKTYYYQLEIDSKLSIHGFNFELIENERYNVLTIENDKKIIIADKSSSLFDIFLSVFGPITTYSIVFILLYFLYKSVKYYFAKSKNPYD
ncbi:hypothetical protein FCV44_11110, partial [Vibrio kanaloae]